MKNMVNTQAKRVLLAYGIGVLVLLIIINTPLFVPCIFKIIFDLPCPACGLTRALVLAIQLDFVGAATMNILFVPLAIFAVAYFIAVLMDVFIGKQAIERINKLMNRKWVIALAAVLMCVSWYYNWVRGI